MLTHDEAHQRDNESLGLTFAAQILLRPPRDRVEAFGRAACLEIGASYRNVPRLGPALGALLDAQEPEDRAACEHLLTHLIPYFAPELPFTEAIFQSLIEGAMTA